jgi:transcriptional regulator with XRE-family HTH domain
MTSTKNAQDVRRKQFTATAAFAARSLALVMDELQEAEISARIKQARKEAGLTQTEFAELLEVIPRTVQNYESGRVPYPRMKQIADITGKSIRWLLHGTGADPGVESALIERMDAFEARLAGLDDLLRQLVTAAPEDAQARAEIDAAVLPLRDLARRRLAGQLEQIQPEDDVAGGSGE